MRGITYQIAPSEAEANSIRIKRVIDAVRSAGLDLTYAAAHVDGQGRFVHVVQGTDFAAFEALPEFQEFQSALRAHLMSPPQAFDFELIGASGPLDGLIG